MKKNVVIINDKIGTIALGFSRSGYEVSAMCIDYSDKNAVKICRDNWGDQARIVNWNDCVGLNINVDFIAGIIPASRVSKTNRITVNESAIHSFSMIIDLLYNKRPKYFLFQYSFCGSCSKPRTQNI